MADLLMADAQAYRDLGHSLEITHDLAAGHPRIAEQVTASYRWRNRCLGCRNCLRPARSRPQSTTRSGKRWAGIRTTYWDRNLPTVTWPNI